MPERQFGCDISFYQDNPYTTPKPDLSKMKGVGLKFVVLRHSQNLTRDPLFEYYWKECDDHNIWRMTYGFLQYWAGSADAGLQGKFLADWFQGKPKTRGWCDFEQPNANYPALPPRQNCLDMIHNWMDQVDAGMEIESGLYTNLNTLAYLKPIPEWLAKRPFWLAWPVTIPANTDRIEYTRTFTAFPQMEMQNLLMWQALWNGPGIQAGMESLGLDCDYFMGGMLTLALSCGIHTIPTPTPTKNQRLAILFESISTIFLEK